MLLSALVLREMVLLSDVWQASITSVVVISYTIKVCDLFVLVLNVYCTTSPICKLPSIILKLLEMSFPIKYLHS